jgi:DNA-binding NarL/FixJ family response regulator
MHISILVIDDHELVRKGIISLLGKEEDFRIVGEASDGMGAIKLAEELCPDVVVLDVEMPGLDGIESARRIANVCPGAKILALSMHEEQDYVIAMLTTGARGYILKDSALEELVQAIRTVQSGQRYLSPELVDVVLESLEGGTTARPQTPLSTLTEREIEVLSHIANGQTSKEIAATLHLSVKTIDAHRQQLMRKLEIYTVAELTKFALRVGLVEP